MMPPKGYRKHPVEPDASPSAAPNDTYLVLQPGALQQDPAWPAAEARRIEAEVALIHAAQKMAAWSPDIASPGFRGPFTKDKMALLAALAEYHAANGRAG
jgi:hypothetical protein